MARVEPPRSNPMPPWSRRWMKRHNLWSQKWEASKILTTDLSSMDPDAKDCYVMTPNRIIKEMRAANASVPSAVRTSAQPTPAATEETTQAATKVHQRCRPRNLEPPEGRHSSLDLYVWWWLGVRAYFDDIFLANFMVVSIFCIQIQLLIGGKLLGVHYWGLMTHKYRGCIVVLSINKSVEPNEEQKVLMSGFDQGFTTNTSKRVFRGIWQYR
jgi:hypothetical protein